MKNDRIFRFFVLLTLFLAVSINITAQVNDYNSLPSGLSHSQYSVSTDILTKEIKGEKNYWLTAVEVVGLNLGVGAFNAYVMNEDFAQISWKTIGDNFETGFVWDEDSYLTNQFSHPFHGSLYYNLARSNGLEFWKAVPYTLGGSLMWEYFMENEPPSYNDLVNTSVTGITFGEISYRVSNLIIDESTTGFERILRELTSTIINPMQGFNRIINGDMWSLKESAQVPHYKLNLFLGSHTIFLNNTASKTTNYVHMGFQLEYGSLTDVKDHNKPFDFFDLHTDLNISSNDQIVGIFATGVLWDTNLKLFNSSNNIMGVYKEIDFLVNNVYKLSATSVSGLLTNIIPLSSSLSMINFIGTSAILMGGINSQYAKEFGKDYNLGPGASVKAGIKFDLTRIGNISINYKRYWLHTLNGADSDEYVGLLNTELLYNMLNNTAVGINFLMYDRLGDYKYFPAIQTSKSAVRFFILQSI